MDDLKSPNAFVRVKVAKVLSTKAAGAARRARTMGATGEEDRPLFNTRIIAAQEERHYTSTCLYGRVLDISCVPSSDGLAFVDLDPKDDVRRTLVVRGERVQMFPPFLIGRDIAAMCRPQVHETSFTLHGFTALADVVGLTEQEADALWWWRRDALRCLCDERFQMTTFEEDICVSMWSWGAPPSPRQRRALRDVVRQRASRPPARTLETIHRAARYDAARGGGGPTSIREGMAELLDWMIKNARGATSHN